MHAINRFYVQIDKKHKKKQIFRDVEKFARNVYIVVSLVIFWLKTSYTAVVSRIPALFQA